MNNSKGRKVGDWMYASGKHSQILSFDVNGVAHIRTWLWAGESTLEVEFNLDAMADGADPHIIGKWA